jgi:hypothetical protein
MLLRLDRSTITNPVIPTQWLVMESVLALACIALFIAALIIIIRTKDQPPATIIVWVVITFVLPILGPLLWFIGGRKASR